MQRELVFQLWQHPELAVAQIAAVIAIAIVLIVLLRAELGLVSRRVGALLLLLRLAVLAAILIVLARPVLTWTLDKRLAGRFLVAVDVSGSMATSDPHATRAEKLQWARAAGLIGNPAINPRLDQWQDALDRNEDPLWVTPDETNDPQLRETLAASRREQLQQVLADVDRLSRIDLVTRYLHQTEPPLLDRLKTLGTVELFAFAGQSEPILGDDWSSTIKQPPAALRLDQSNLSAALPPTGAGPDPRAVILLTDGRDHSGRSPTLLAKNLADSNCPVWPVMIGTPRKPKDLAIVSVDAPTTVYRQDSPRVQFWINTSGFAGEPITVELREEGGGAADNQPLKSLTLQGTGGTVSGEFQLDADNIGRRHYELRIPFRDGETRPDNNSRRFSVAVVDDRAHVLLVDEAPRWEYRYLDAALARDDRIELKHVLFQQPRLGLLQDHFLPNQWAQLGPLDQLLEGLDLVIIGDVSPQYLTQEHWDRLERFVGEAGGTIVFCAGKQSLPSSHRTPTFESLLPITHVRPFDVAAPLAIAPPVIRGLPLQLSPEGESLPMLKFAADAQENRQLWSRLPGPVWMMFGEAKPAATVWVTAQIPEALRGPLNTERQSAWMVHQHYGVGQTVWIGSDSTWRWRHRAGDRFHHRFWGQLARWAANTKLAAGNAFVKFGPEQPEVEQHQPLLFRARFSPTFLREHPDIRVQAELLRPTDQQVVATIPLKPVPGRPLLHEGQSTDLPTGNYRARLRANRDELGRDPIETDVTVRDQATPELADLSANQDLLNQLAEAGNTRLLTPRDLQELPNLLRPTDQAITETREDPLWNHWSMLLLIFALLTAEWIVRKWNGLP